MLHLNFSPQFEAEVVAYCNEQGLTVDYVVARAIEQLLKEEQK
jgi:hypothetical protein